MTDKDLVRLRHMLDSTNAVLSFVKGKKRATLDTNRLLVSGIVRELEILGEAAGKVSQKTPNKNWFMSERRSHLFRHCNQFER